MNTFLVTYFKFSLKIKYYTYVSLVLNLFNFLKYFGKNSLNNSVNFLQIKIQSKSK